MAGAFRRGDLARRSVVRIIPGDDFYPAPYAYVSAHDHDGGQFWNVPFGALRDAGEFGSSEDLVAFWREGRALLRGA